MKLIYALAIILSINVFLFLGQTSVDNINPGAVSFYNYEGSLLQDFDAGNYTVSEDVNNELPGGTSSVSPTTGNIFTDSWVTIKNWFSEATGFKYLKGIVNAFPNFLKAIGLPTAFAFALGVFWHGITIFLIVAFLRGGGGY